MITISQLNFGYRKNHLLFRDLSMQLQAGHIYGLLGKNGAGKSSLLKNIAGLVYPQSGQLDILGHDPRKREPKFLSQVCFVPEEFYLPSVSVNKYLQAYTPFYPDFDEPYLKDLLSEFSIPQDQKLLDMSYGQKKKFVIAFGLASRARLVIMDEPTNGLDIPSKAQFRKIIASALTEDRCIVISTHQVRDLDNLIDSIIMLDENSISLMARVEDITARLSFKRVQELNDSVIYAEPALSGYNAVFPNINGDDSRLDIELLFNAVLADKSKIKPLFN